MKIIKPGKFNFEPTDLKREEYDKENFELINKNIDILFYGDSITEWWQLEKMNILEKTVVNRAIAGDRTRYMLYRFDADCIQLFPKQVVFMGGINDLRGWNLNHDYLLRMTGSHVFNEVVGNITTMANKCEANNIKFAVGSILPINEDSDVDNEKVNEKVEKINNELKAICHRKKLVYIDYYSEMVEKNNKRIVKEFTIEGLHPNELGYEKMEKVLKDKIEL